MQKISIIIVNWNTEELLNKQLEILESAENELEIIIVNNSKKFQNLIKCKNNNVIVLQNEFNKGYAFACNQGTLIAKNDWLLFLNPDVLISPKEIFKWLHQHIYKNLDASSPIQTSEKYFKPLPSLLSLLTEFTPLNKIIPLNIFNPKTLVGGALLIKKTVLKNLGGWDERFFLWFEDSDLTKRLLDSGYKISWIENDFNHFGGKSFLKVATQTKKDIFFNSMEVYARKHFNYLSIFIIKLIRLRYSKNKILPVLESGTSITIPNIRKDLLFSFLDTNKKILNELKELIVVSSALNYSNVWELRKKYPQVRFIPISKNFGFTHTVNIGFRISSTNWIGTFNDDIVIKNMPIDLSIKNITGNIGSINPIILNKKGEVESAGIKILKRGKAVPIKKISLNKIKVVDSTNAAAVIYNSSILNKVGIFDENFSSYLEDVDLSLRINKLGFSNIVINNCEVTHAGQSTSSIILGRKKRLYDAINWIQIILKNWKIKDIFIFFPLILIERAKNFYGIIKK